VSEWFKCVFPSPTSQQWNWKPIQEAVTLASVLMINKTVSSVSASPAQRFTGKWLRVADGDGGITKCLRVGRFVMDISSRASNDLNTFTLWPV